MPNLLRTLAQLGLSLVNATVLLALALALVIWQVVGRGEAIATATSAALDRRLASIAVLPRLDGLDERIAAAASAADPSQELAALRAELELLRAELAALRAQPIAEPPARVVAAAPLDDVAARLARLVPPGSN
jgi:hypothetical protein